MSVQPIDSFTDSDGTRWLRLSNGHKVRLSTAGGGGHDHPQYVLDTGDTMTGPLIVDTNGIDSAVRVSGEAGYPRVLSFHTDLKHRFVLGLDAIPETATDRVGSNLYLNRYDNAGVQGTGTTVLGVSRATGVVNFREQPTVDNDEMADVATASGWATYGGEYGNVQVTRFGPLVTLQGLIKRTASTFTPVVDTAYTVGTVPAKFVPNVTVTGTAFHSGSKAVARVVVDGSGTVMLVFTTTASIATGSWIPVNLSWRCVQVP